MRAAPRLASLFLVSIAAIGALSVACGQKRHLLGRHTVGTPDAAPVASAPPDAAPEEPPPLVAPDAAPPASLAFDPEPWAPGTVVKIRRASSLVDSKGGASADDGFGLQLTVASTAGADVVGSTGPDCIARLGGGTAKITGACQGNDADVAYKLDIIGQVLAVPRGTVTVGDRTDAFARPLVALFKLQDAGALVNARVADIHDQTVVYAVHIEVEGTMIKHGMQLVSSLDGTIEVDAKLQHMIGHFGPARATISGGPMTDYHSKGTLTLDFSIAPAR